MRQWHQGKEGFMKVTRIQDKYNPDKVWMIKRYLCGTFYVNQEIKGDELYFPKTENIIAPARNRRIKKEWNGYNSKELAEKYNLTTKQIGNILKDEPMIGQMSIFDMNNDD